MRTRTLLVLALAALALPFAAPVARGTEAPQARPFWLSVLGGYVRQSPDVDYPDSLDSGLGAGLRLGGAFDRRWAWELSGAWSPVREAQGRKRDVDYANAAASLLCSPLRWGSATPYAALGLGMTRRSGKGFDSRQQGGIEAALGLQSWITRDVALRIEARNVLSVVDYYGGRYRSDQQYWVGLTWAPLRAASGRSAVTLGTPIGPEHDQDRDGVPDRLDRCPDTPTDCRIDEHGCPVDSDDDGVCDGRDKCAGTPHGVVVDLDGCPRDTDGDGVPDAFDQCPGTPRGCSVNGAGCPVDTDGDGVCDALDQCPDTPKGAQVDARGCPGTGSRETELLDTGRIRLDNVHFETGKATLLPESYGPLDEAAGVLRKYPQLRIEVGGHTDSRGAPIRNRTLSEARAQAVRDYLLRKHPDIEAKQLTAKGYGSTKPVVPNTSPENMAKNRRVEFVVLNRDVLEQVTKPHAK